jgi:hypothetical protein
MEIHNGVAKTKQQMASEYGICIKTFDRLLKKKKIKLDRGLIYPKDQLCIYNELGVPESIQKYLKIPKSSF